MKQWYTAIELAGLAGLQITDRRIREKAKRGEWKARKRQGSKAMEYHIKSLPLETQQLLNGKLLTDGMEEVNAMLAMLNEAIARLEKFKEVMKGLSHE